MPAPPPKRRVFYSFPYNEDSQRAAQVRNRGITDPSPPVSDNDWKQIKRSGPNALQQ